MSIHSRFDNPTSVTALNTAPIVLRFKGMFPRDLKRREMHDKRTGGDLSHIRRDLSGLNTQVIGEADWIARLLEDIAHAREDNLEQEIAARERKGRHKEAEKVRARGPVDPWKFTREGPLREGVLTVNKLWFGGTGYENWDPVRVEAFKKRGLDFLITHFPGRQLQEVNIDEDEEAVHFHFAIAVWVEKTSQNRGQQWLLQPSANPLLANYEHAQDLAGEAFADLGIHRGARRAAAARQALAAGLEAPEPRRHVPPSDWRREQRLLALKERALILDEARAEAEVIVADGAELAKAEAKKSRKRARRYAKAKRAKIARQFAAAERVRAQADTQEVAARRAKEEAEDARNAADLQAEAARAEAARITQAAADRAGEVVANATALATAAMRKSRKRAIAEAKARKREADRAALAAERARAQEEARAAAARREREEAEAARSAAEQAAAYETQIAQAAQTEAADAKARADALAAGLESLSEEIAAGTLGRMENGMLDAKDPETLRAAGPEIIPALQAAGTLVDRLRAAERATVDMVEATIRSREEVIAETVAMRTAARAEIARERDAARSEIETERRVVTAELDGMRDDLKRQISVLQTLMNKFEPLLTRVVRWLSRPELPWSLRAEGSDITRDANEMLDIFRQNNLDL